MNNMYHYYPRRRRFPTKILIGVILIFVIGYFAYNIGLLDYALLYLPTFGEVKNCSDENCIKEAALTCTPAKWYQSDSRGDGIIEVKGGTMDRCRMYMGVYLRQPISITLEERCVDKAEYVYNACSERLKYQAMQRAMKELGSWGSYWG